MGMEQRALNEDVTHWSFTGQDSYNGYTFASPVLLRGRWQGKDHLQEQTDDREELSNAEVYISADVQIGDFIAMGDHTDPSVADPLTVAGAWKIRDFDRKTDLRNLNTIRKAIL